MKITYCQIEMRGPSNAPCPPSQQLRVTPRPKARVQPDRTSQRLNVYALTPHRSREDQAKQLGHNLKAMQHAYAAQSHRAAYTLASVAAVALALTVGLGAISPYVSLGVFLGLAPLVGGMLALHLRTLADARRDMRTAQAASDLYDMTDTLLFDGASVDQEGASIAFARINRSLYVRGKYDARIEPMLEEYVRMYNDTFIRS